AADSWPTVRDPDELHDALLTLIVLPPVPEWQVHFDALRQARRAMVLVSGNTALWVAAERLELAREVYRDVVLIPEIQATAMPRGIPDSQEGCVAEILRGWLESTGPSSAEALSSRLAIPLDLVEAGLARLEGEGQILCGR